MKRNLRLFFKWLLFSPLYIKEAQSVGVTKWKRNLLFICSPFILICIGLVLGTVIPVAFFGGLLLVALTEKDEPLPYDSVRFKTREEIVNVTGLEDFPEFSYITNDDADWTGIGVYVYLEFKDELPESFMKSWKACRNPDRTGHIPTVDFMSSTAVGAMVADRFRERTWGIRKAQWKFPSDGIQEISE